MARRGERTAPQHVVLIGFGPVGVRFAEEILPAVEDGRVALTVIGAEREDPYNRIMIAEYATGDVARENLQIANPTDLAARGVRVLAGRSATRIRPEGREIELDDGRRLPYDRLVLATGAQANVPRLDGLSQSAPSSPGLDAVLTNGVCALRSIADAERVRSVVTAGGRVAVLGAGVLGLELALLLAGTGSRPHLAHFGPIPMPRQLDRGSAHVLSALLAHAGVAVVPHTRAEAIVTREVAGRRTFRTLVSSDGKRIEADLLVLSCGVRPRDELAVDASLRTARGVLVDNRLRSWSDPHIHAIGDVAHVADPSAHRHSRTVPGGASGLVGPGWRQAEWLARSLLAELDGNTEPDYVEDLPGIVTMKASQLDLVAAGRVPADPFAPTPRDEPVTDTAMWADPQHGTYVAMATTGGVLDGFVTVGMPRAAAELSVLYQRRGELPSDRSLLLRLDAVDEAPSANDRDQTICLCNAVTAGAIEDAVREHDCTTVEAVGRCTRAGTGCGGCRARIAEMLRESEGQPA